MKFIRSLWRGARLNRLNGFPRLEMQSDEYLKRYYATYSPPAVLVYPDEYVTEPMPTYTNLELGWAFAQYKFRYAPSATVLCLPDCKAWGKDAAIITRENILLRDVSRCFGYRSEHRVFHKGSITAPTKKSDNVAVLTTSGANTYYHWLFDILPRLHLLDKAGLTSSIDKFIVPELKYSFQTDSLNLLNINPDKLLVANDDSFHIKAKNVMVPSLPSLLGTVNRWTIEFLRAAFVTDTNATSRRDRRIYIARNQASTRRLVNEWELIETLEKLDFLIFRPEEHSLQEQIRIFSESSVIVAPHGSGLSNMVFSQEGAFILELFDARFIVPCYWILANQCKHRYHCIVSGKQDEIEEFKPYWEQTARDFSCNVSEVTSFLSSKLDRRHDVKS